MKTLLRAAAMTMALTIAGGAAAQPASSSTPLSTPPMDAAARPTILSLSASGELRASPDMATINLAVVTDGKTAAEALAANAMRMNAVMAALRKAGLAERDIQTSGLNLNPQYRYVENQPPVLTGYQASNQVTVIVRDLRRVGAAVDATVGAGVNQVNGITFGLADPTQAENAAREAAVKALAAKADLYARATGGRLTRLASLSEGGGYSPPPPVPMPVFAAARMKDSTPIASGELVVRIEINGVYEMSR